MEWIVKKIIRGDVCTSCNFCSFGREIKTLSLAEMNGNKTTKVGLEIYSSQIEVANHAQPLRYRQITRLLDK